MPALFTTTSDTNRQRPRFSTISNKHHHKSIERLLLHLLSLFFSFFLCSSLEKLYLKNQFLLIEPMMLLRLKFPFKYRLKLKSKGKVAAWKATFQPHHQVSPPPPSCGLSSAWGRMATAMMAFWSHTANRETQRPCRQPTDTRLWVKTLQKFSTSPFNLLVGTRLRLNGLWYSDDA